MSRTNESGDSGVFDDLKGEMEDTGASLKQLLQDAKSGEGSKGEVKRKLEAEAKSTGRSLRELVNDVRERAEENGRHVTEQLNQEYKEFRNR